MSLPALLAIAFLAGSIFAGAGAWKVQAWRHDAERAQRLEAQAETDRLARRNVNVAAQGHEADKAQIRTEFVTITQEVERVVSQIEYRDGVCLDPDGLRVLRAAIHGTDAGGSAGGPVPGPAGPGGRQPSGDAAVVDPDRARVPRVPEPAPPNR